jgi:hypothetical protein
MDDFSAAGSFTHVMRERLTRSGYNACQVARLAGLPRRTVANWQEGGVTKPRNWLDVVHLSRALRLPLNEANKLLAAAATRRWRSYSNSTPAQFSVRVKSHYSSLSLRLNDKQHFLTRFHVYSP